MENEGSTSAGAPKLSEGVTGWIESVIITSSQTTVGQALFKLIDSFLWVVEKSTQWSLPSHEIAAEENGKVFGKIELVRPLPWILFLPGLVILRIIRGTLNIGAFVLGYPRIQPSGMVKFVQKGRRRLRALNLKAVKATRRKTCNKDKRLTMIEAKKALIKSIRLTLSTLYCLDTSKSSPSPPPTKIRVSRADLEVTSTPDEKSTTESAGSPIHVEMKRKFSQVSTDVDETTDESENETLQSKLERFAMDDSTDDPDFNPTECTTESSTASSESEVDKEVSMTELAEVREDAKEILEEKGLMVSTKEMISNMTDTENTGDSVKRVDSSETNLQNTSKVTSDFINGEINSSSGPPPPTGNGASINGERIDVPETTGVASSPTEVTNGVLEKSNPKSESAIPSSANRTSVLKEHTSAGFQEKKGNKHKKGGRRDFK